MTPMHWTKATLADLCDLVKGTTPIQKSQPGPYPLVTTGEHHKTADHFQFDAEAVCVPMISSTGHGHASLKRVHYQSGKFALANLLSALLVRKPVVLLPRFLALYLNYFKDQLIVPLMTGAANMNITVDRLAKVLIGFPATKEQRRILDVVAEVELARGLRDQADGRTEDLVPAIFHEMFGDSANNRHLLSKLSELAEVVSGVAKGRQFNGQQTVTVPYLRVANVQAGHLDLSEIKTIEALPSEAEELALKKGDVLLTEGGDFDKLGRGAVWEGAVPVCIHQNHVFRVRVNESKLLPFFLSSYLQTDAAKQYFLRCAKKTTNLASINMTQLKGLVVPAPPIYLQQTFAARVAEVRALQAQQAASRRRFDDLYAALLHRAFRGEL